MTWEWFGSFWLRLHLPSFLKVSWIFAFLRGVPSFFCLNFCFSALPPLDKGWLNWRELATKARVLEEKIIVPRALKKREKRIKSSLLTGLLKHFDTNLNCACEIQPKTMLTRSTFFIWWRRRQRDHKEIIVIIRYAYSKTSNFLVNFILSTQIVSDAYFQNRKQNRQLREHLWNLKFSRKDSLRNPGQKYS